MSNDNKPKFELPPRFYYSLEQAAKELGCEADYLLHLGATGRAELLARIPYNIAVMLLSHKFRNEYIDTGAADFFTLFCGYCAAIELDGYVVAERWDTIWEINNYAYDFPILCKSNGSIQDDTPLDQYGSFYEKQEIRREELNKFTAMVKPTAVTLTVKATEVYISATELERIKQNTPMNAEQTTRMTSSESKSLPARTENLLFECVAALAMMYTKSDCSKPYEAAATICEALDLHGISERTIGKETLGKYISSGLNRLSKTKTKSN